MQTSLSSQDPSNAVSPSRQSQIEALLQEDLTPRRDYAKQKEEGLFCVRWNPPIDKYFDYISSFRDTIGVNLGGTRESRYEYTDPTIAQVMSVGPGDDRSSLPQRVTLSNFKLGNPITSYGCICRYDGGSIESKDDSGSNSNGSNSDSSPSDTNSDESPSNDSTPKSPLTDTNSESEYLLIRRNDSVSYIDMIRGSYRDSQLFFMIQDLPEWERDRLLEYDFDDLWEDLHLKAAEGDAYEFAKEKFNKIKSHLPTLFEDFPSRDPDGKYLWLFPKGKPDYRPISDYDESDHTNTQPKDDHFIDPLRLVPESPFECALREFNEETNGLELYEDDLRWEDPIIERYLGSNSKNYQTDYFIFEFDTKPDLTQFPRSKTKIRDVSVGEVDTIAWVPYSQLDQYLCPARLKLCKYIENYLPNRYPEGVKSIWKCPAELSEFLIE